MASRRVYELARERGLSTAELIQRLERDGIHGKKGLSTIDEELVEAALANTSGLEEAEPAPTGGPQRFDDMQGNDLGPLERRRRIWQLRREQEAQLKELGGLAVELRRLGSSRYEELAGEKLEQAAATERELLALERQVAPENVGGVCPNCGLASKRTRYCLRCGEELPGHHTFSPLSPVAALFVIAAIAGAWLLGGITFGGGDGAQSQTAYPPGAGTRDLGAGNTTAAAKPKYRNIVASVNTPRINIYRKPKEGAKPKMKLNNPNLDGAKVVFLVIKRKGKWLKVWLPERPNGSKGWIAREHVTLTGHSYRMKINLDRHFLKVWKGKKRVFKTKIGVGEAVTPTPTGKYYITELLEQPDPSGTYGPYAFGLSAHSDVLNEFAGRDGVLGIHGTNFPQGIGTDVSHGCIRMSNKAVTRLAKFLPVGTPVEITRSPGTSA